jgi:hypothetical protein
MKRAEVIAPGGQIVAGNDAYMVSAIRRPQMEFERMQPFGHDEIATEIVGLVIVLVDDLALGRPAESLFGRVQVLRRDPLETGPKRRIARPRVELVGLRLLCADGRRQSRDEK